MPVSSAVARGTVLSRPRAAIRRDLYASRGLSGPLALPSGVLLPPTRLIRASEARRPTTGPFMPPSRPSKRLSGLLLRASKALNRASEPLLPASEALDRVSGPLLPGSEALNRASEHLLPASEPWKGAAGLVKPVREGVGRGTRHKVMQPAVRKPIGSVRNRARSNPHQRCGLAPGRRSNEEDGLDPDAVQRALHRAPAAVQDVSVDHGCRDVLVTQQLLYRSDVIGTALTLSRWSKRFAGSKAGKIVTGLSRPCRRGRC